ncbi:hypothetical protein MNBD_GAMMA22-1249 [hydrothermal vent metagenome]|uniref:Uncharacterized protein n=1 Tax=hydrothermal vent metagenome TaxID=652676 RepID=A0A3B1AVU1_9ZZZZ
MNLSTCKNYKLISELPLKYLIMFIFIVLSLYMAINITLLYVLIPDVLNLVQENINDVQLMILKNAMNKILLNSSFGTMMLFILNVLMIILLLKAKKLILEIDKNFG